MNAAATMGMENDIGKIAPSRLADLVILDADPLANVTNLSKVSRVIKDGQGFTPTELMNSLH